MATCTRLSRFHRRALCTGEDLNTVCRLRASSVAAARSLSELSRKFCKVLDSNFEVMDCFPEFL